MSGLKEKSIQNFFSAECLRKREIRCYSASVHCLYYSCLQYMTYVLISHNIIDRTLQEEAYYAKKGTHETVKNRFETAYIKKTTAQNFNDFKEWFGQLQQNRIESDYYENLTTEEDSNRSYDLAKRILNQIKGVYK